MACCTNCCFANHRSCNQVLDLKNDAHGLLLEIKPIKVLGEMKILEDHLMNFEKRNDSYIISLESQVQEMTNKVKEIRKKLNELLDDLERKFQTKGNQLYNEEVLRKQEENRECQAQLNAVRNLHFTLETVMKHGSDTQIFIMADRMISQVNLCFEQIKEKFEKLCTVNLNLEVDSQIEILLAQKSDIGRVVCKRELERFPISRVERSLKERQIEMENAVKIKGPDMSPDFRGVTYLQGDQLILADYSNKRVILLNSSYQCIACFTLPDNPWDVCVVDHQKVCVSLPHQKTLQVLCITIGAITPTRNVQTRYKCCGVASVGNGKIVVFSSCNNGKCYWSLYESTGREMCYTFDCQSVPSFTYFTLNSSCTRVYISVRMANSLYCFDLDGRMMYIYRSDSLKWPVGVATDRDDNVYVVGQMFNNMHQLTSDGTLIRIFTEGIPRSSMAICFSNSLDRFLITSNTVSGFIYVFRLK